MSTYYSGAIADLAAARTFSETGSATMELMNLEHARRAVEILTAAAVKSARQDGQSWREIGHALGVTRQAAQQKYQDPKLF